MLVAVLAGADGCVVEVGGEDGSDDESTESSDLDVIIARHGNEHNHLPNNVPVFDATGVFTTVSTHGFIDLNNEFFQDLGSNGRRCVSCHLPTAAWSITPAQVRLVFEATRGGEVDDLLGLGAAGGLEHEAD
ncbi:MAG TPA: hypothetical protein VK607_17745, partial [Kofleriaceae bacterium]|nr:hypothetical protein [Kofleriaceae bacterium]